MNKPNEETIAAFKEEDKILARGIGKRFNNLDACGTVWRREDA